jgi:hypothetical protein
MLNELAKWVANAIKSSLEGMFKAAWRAFWTGSLVSTAVISVLIVVAASFVMSGLGVSGSESSSAMRTLGAILLVAWLVRLIIYMVMGGSRSGGR